MERKKRVTILNGDLRVKFNFLPEMAHIFFPVSVPQEMSV